MPETIASYENYLEQKNLLLEKIGRIAEIARDMKLDVAAKNMSDLMEKVRGDTFQILVMGEFNTGKTTLINALLGEELLPAGIDPTTAAITLIGFGESLEIFFTDGNGHRDRISREQLDEFITIAKSGGADRKVERIDIAYPSPLCGNGVRIVDSPGLNEDMTRNEITYAHVPSSDAAIMVLSALQLCTAEEMRFVLENLVERGHEHIFFVVNKTDLIGREKDKKELEQRALEKLGDYCDTENRLFFVSSADALDGKTTGGGHMLEQSRFPLLETELERFLAGERGKAAIQSPVRQAGAVAEDVRRFLATRSELGKVRLAELENRCAAVEPKFEILGNKRDKILGSITDRRKSVSRMIQYDFENMILKLRGEVKDAVSKFNVDTRWENETLKKNMISEFNRFAESKIDPWSKNVEAAVAGQIEDLFSEIGHDLETIRKELEEIEFEVSRIPKDLGEFEKMSADKVIEKILNSGGEFLANSEEFDQGLTMGFIQQFGLQLGTAILFRLMGFNIFFIVGATVFSGISGVFLRQNIVERKIKAKFSDGVREELSKLPERFGPEIDREVRTFFDKLGRAFQNGIDVMIEDLRTMLDAVTEEKRKQSEKTESENRMLDEYSEELRVILEDIRRIPEKFA